MADELQPLTEPVFFCRNSEQFGDGSPIYLLPTKRPTWWLQNDLPWMSHGELQEVIQKALDAWSAVCDVKGTMAPNAQSASFLITVASLDGPGGVLADMQLPSPGLRQQRMRIDIAEQALKHRLPAIITHEFGHAFALQHFPVSPPPELMEPRISNIDLPQPTEAALMAKWYGLPQSPSPDPGLPEVPPMVCTLRVEPSTKEIKCNISVQQGDKRAELSGKKPW
jgi:hypothetical protein